MVLSMMRTHLNINDRLGPTQGLDEAPDWSALYARIRLLALSRTETMAAIAIDEVDSFDRGARALRTLMSAAEIARRMKAQDEKESDLHEAGKVPVITDEKIRDIKTRLETQIARLEQEDQSAALSDHNGRGLSWVS